MEIRNPDFTIPHDHSIIMKQESETEKYNNFTIGIKH